MKKESDGLHNRRNGSRIRGSAGIPGKAPGRLSGNCLLSSPPPAGKTTYSGLPKIIKQDIVSPAERGTQYPGFSDALPGGGTEKRVSFRCFVRFWSERQNCIWFSRPEAGIIKEQESGSDAGISGPAPLRRGGTGPQQQESTGTGARTAGFPGEKFKIPAFLPAPEKKTPQVYSETEKIYQIPETPFAKGKKHSIM